MPEMAAPACVSVREGTIEERFRKTTHPHDAVGEAFAADEPLVDVQDDWVVEETGTDGPEDALDEDELPDVGREG